VRDRDENVKHGELEIQSTSSFDTNIRDYCKLFACNPIMIHICLNCAVAQAHNM